MVSLEKYLTPQREKKLDKGKKEKDSITTLNLSKTQLVELGKNHPSLNSLNYIELEEFMEKYLRKLFISSEYKSFNIRAFGKSAYFIKRLFDYVAITVLLPLSILFIIYIFLIKLLTNNNTVVIKYGHIIHFNEKKYKSKTVQTSVI